MRLPPFEQVVEDHGPALLRFCAGRAGPDRAEDVFQESMIAALRAYAELRDPDAIRPWLFAIAARKAIDAHRAAARAPAPVEDVDRFAGEADPPVFEAGIWIQVKSLPDKQRQAVGLRFLADMSHGEIGEAMGTSEEASRRNVHEGLRRLRRELGDDLTFSEARGVSGGMNVKRSDIGMGADSRSPGGGGRGGGADRRRGGASRIAARNAARRRDRGRPGPARAAGRRRRGGAGRARREDLTPGADRTAIRP